MRWVYATSAAAIVTTLAADICTDIDIDFRIAAAVSLVYIAILTTVFAVLYLVRSKWWTNRIGRIFLAQSIMLALVVIQGAISVWWPGDYPGKDYVRFAIYSAGAVAYVPMIVSLWREQQRDRKRLRFPNGIPRSEVTDPPDSS